MTFCALFVLRKNMASSASKPRTSSPFRFRKAPSVNGSKTSPSSSGSQTPTSAYKTIGISLTPGKGRSSIPTPPSSVTPPPKFRHSSASSASAGSPRTPTSSREDFLNRAKENVSVTVRFRPLRYFAAPSTALLVLTFSRIMHDD